MISGRRPPIRTLLFLALGLLVAGSAGAQTITPITWNNPAGGLWSDAANWSPANVPDDPNERAVLNPIGGAGYLVTLDIASDEENPLIVGGLTVGDLVELNVHGTDFEIEWTPPDLASNRGTIRLTGGAFVNVDRPLFSNRGGTIVGGSATDTQGGTFMVAPTGRQHVGPAATLDNTGGRLVSDGGDLTVRFGLVVGGTFERTSGIKAVRVQSASLQDVTNAAGSEIVLQNFDTVTPTHGTMHFTGTMDVLSYGQVLGNNGTIRVPTGTWLSFAGEPGQPASYARTLGGTGEVILEGGHLDTPKLGPMINGAGHTIRGCGIITANIINLGTIETGCGGGEMVISRPITNRGRMTNLGGTMVFRGAAAQISNSGLLAAQGGSIRVEDGATIDNSRGVFTANGHTVELGRNGSTLIGGRLEVQGAGVFRNVGATTLRNVTIAPSGLFETAPGATSTADGSFLYVNGTNRIDLNGTFAVGPTTQYNQMAGETQLAGGRLTAPGGVQIFAGSLGGAGTIVGNVRNAGVLSTATTSARLRIEGDYHQLASGRINLALTPDDAVQVLDRPGPVRGIDITGAANLDGVFEASAAVGFDAKPGSLLEVLTYRSLAGQFSEVVGAVPSGRLAPVYQADRLELQVARGVQRRPDAGIVAADGTIPVELRLYGHTGAGETSFVLDLPREAELSVRAYDAAGREVGVLASGVRPAGVYRFSLAGIRGGLTKGIYFARAEIRGADGITTRTARVAVIR